MAGVCDKKDVRDAGVAGRRFGCEEASGESARLKGEDLCAPNDSGLGFLGEVDCCWTSVCEIWSQREDIVTIGKRPAIAAQ